MRRRRRVGERKKPLAAETHCAVWLPRGFDEVQERVKDHLLDGEGETTWIKQRMSRGGAPVQVERS